MNSGGKVQRTQSRGDKMEPPETKHKLTGSESKQTREDCHKRGIQRGTKTGVK